MISLSQTISKIGWKVTRNFSKLGKSDSGNEELLNLEKFKKTQRLAYQCALAIAKEIQEGWTEIQTARLMDAYLMDCGVKTFFHKSFVWFGERTRFQNFSTYFHFLPSEKKLKQGEVIILDTAPILNGFTADIGYTFSLEPHPELLLAKKKLITLRTKIKKLFELDLKTKDIWHEINDDLKQEGYDTIHAQYPFSVLGHRVHWVPASSWPGLVRPFSWQSYWALFSRGFFPELLGPYHEGSAEGLWAIEPHLGGEGFGAKFEEILVVRKKEVYWLDEKVPHVEELQSKLYKEHQ